MPILCSVLKKLISILNSYRLPILILLCGLLIGLNYSYVRTHFYGLYQGMSMNVWLSAYLNGDLGAGVSKTGRLEGNEDVLRRMGTNALPRLIQATRAKDSRAVIALREVVRKLSRSSVGPVSGLASKLMRGWIPAENIRMLAFIGISYLGPTAESAVPVLAEGLKDNSDRVRASAAFALGKIGFEADGVISALIVALKDTDADVRGSAVSGLIKTRPVATGAYPQPNEAAVNLDGRIYFSKHPKKFPAAFASLVEAVPALIGALKDQD